MLKPPDPEGREEKPESDDVNHLLSMWMSFRLAAQQVVQRCRHADGVVYRQVSLLA